MCDVLKIIRRKDGVYDLYDGKWWIMSRGCIDAILEYLSKESDLTPVVFEFKDESLEADDGTKMDSEEKTMKEAEALELIRDLCIDYDGFNTVDGLKSLIDDIRAITEETLK